MHTQIVDSFGRQSTSIMVTMLGKLQSRAGVVPSGLENRCFAWAREQMSQPLEPWLRSLVSVPRRDGGKGALQFGHERSEGLDVVAQYARRRDVKGRVFVTLCKQDNLFAKGMR